SDAVFSRSTLDERALRPWQDAGGVDATPIGVSFVNAAAEDGGPSIDIALFGVEPGSFLAPETGTPADGSLDGLVLDEELREDGVKVGDRYTIAGSDVTLPVLGFTSAGSYGHAPIAFTSLDGWRSVVYGNDPRGRFSAIALRVPDGVDTAALAQASDTEVVTKEGAYDGSPGYTAEMATMTLIRGFLIVISALIVGAFFTVLTVQRTRQIGLLKAMGASTLYVVRDGVAQMAIVVALASIAGAVVGTAIVAALDGGPVPVALDAGSIVMSVVLLVVTGIAGSLVTMRRIARVPPAIALGVEP
ncbi:MAG: ABC transporter permease, partial [Solirubrobacteraceae bacterium]|nr:ABC transporter permease [Solirubrobacteraceae bacterium]